MATPFAQTYFHGTRGDLKVGDLIEVGFNSNYGQRKNAKYIFLSATLPQLRLAFVGGSSSLTYSFPFRTLVKLI